ncbi:MAG: hypothetical protein ABIH82_06525, partial [Candidatus Woesearchaeota archaeon]
MGRKIKPKSINQVDLHKVWLIAGIVVLVVGVLLLLFYGSGVGAGKATATGELLILNCPDNVDVNEEFTCDVILDSAVSTYFGAQFSVGLTNLNSATRLVTSNLCVYYNCVGATPNVIVGEIVTINTENNEPVGAGTIATINLIAPSTDGTATITLSDIDVAGELETEIMSLCPGTESICGDLSVDVTVGTISEDCSNTADDDSDGAVDCADSDC